MSKLDKKISSYKPKLISLESIDILRQNRMSIDLGTKLQLKHYTIPTRI